MNLGLIRGGCFGLHGAVILVLSNNDFENLAGDARLSSGLSSNYSKQLIYLRGKARFAALAGSLIFSSDS